METMVRANHTVRDFAQMEEGTRQLVLATLGKAPPKTEKHIRILADRLGQNDLFEGLAKKVANNETLVLDWVSILNMMFIECMREFHPESYDHMLGVRQLIREIREMLQKFAIRNLPDYKIEAFKSLQENFMLEESFWQLLEYAACYHDLGKMAYKKKFWDTPGKFTTAQRDELEAHVRVFYYLGEFFDVNPLVICLSVKHHYDNLGYPTNGIIKKIDAMKAAMNINPEKFQHMLGLLITVDLYNAMGGKRGYQRDFRSEHMEIVSRMGGQLGQIGFKYVPLLHALWELQSRPKVLCLAG